jgi:tetratricopeptide (TPR) repeat protein
MDVKALRAIGTKECIHLTDADAAIAFLRKEGERRKAAEAPSSGRSSGNAVDLVVCDENLRGIPASVFLYVLARERSLRAQPVLVLAGSAASAKGLRAAGLHVLERPYSLDDLEGMTQKAMSPMRSQLRGEEFESAAAKHGLPIQPKKPTDKKDAPPAGGADGTGNAASTAGTASGRKKGPFTITDWYNKGVAHLKAKELPDAERAFMRVLDGQEDNPEAALGLVRVYLASGKEKNMRRYLLKAAVSCLRQGDAERAKTIAARLPERTANNIYIGEAIACLEEGRGKAAAVALLDAAREGDDKPLHQLVARACLRTARPDESMATVCDAFERMGHAATSVALRRRLLRYTPFDRGESASWLDRFPRLKEALSVASYTAWAWRQA